MTERLKQILNNLHKYNPGNLAYVNFGLDGSILYDALVVAPSYSPPKILKDGSFSITELQTQSYCAGYLVEKDGLKIAWIKTAAGGCNILDFLLSCGELRFKRLIFIGAVGALKANFEIGEICTATYSIAGTLANTYLKGNLKDYTPFEKIYPDRAYTAEIMELAHRCGHPIRAASVFCTDSVVMEYTHLDEIKAFGTDLIEMETATFYAVAELMRIPAIALLVVSDNSATGVPLVGRSDDLQAQYEYARTVVLPELIYRIAEAAENA